MFSEKYISQLVVRWEAGETPLAIAKSVGEGDSIIRRLLRDAGCEIQIRKGRRSNLLHSDSPAWRGGRTLSGEYVLIHLAPDDPLRYMADKSGYVREHRLIMAQYLGRPLRSDESVHHIDNDKTNNDISNLQLRQGQHGKGNVLMCADCGSANLVPAR